MNAAAITTATTQPFERPQRAMRSLADEDYVPAGRRFHVPSYHASSSSLPLGAGHLKPLDNSDAELPETSLRPLAAGDFLGHSELSHFPVPFRPLSSTDLAPNTKLPSDPKDMRPLTADDFVPGVKHQPDDLHSRLTTQVQKWVAQTFYGTLLKQMHDSPFKSDLFDGGRGGQAFGTLRDQQLADRMSRGAGNKLVRSIVKRIEARMAYQKHQKTGDTRGTAAPRDAAHDGSAGEQNPQNRGRYKDVKIHVAPALRA